MSGKIWSNTQRHVKSVKYQALNFSANMSMSTAPELNPILHEIINNKGVLTMNRPYKLNSIGPIATKTTLRKLIEWENKVEMVIIKGEGRAFCSGGDIIQIKNSVPHIYKHWFKMAYVLDGFIEQYPVPYVALIDGITMGAGISVAHGHVRIATERTVAATPETKIGFFVDNGLGYILSRLPHQLGQYLGLTGNSLKGTDVVKAGIATHYARSENIPTIFKGLIELKEPSVNLNEFLSKHTEDISNVEFSLEPHLKLIENAFSASSVEEIIKCLQTDGSEFAVQTIERLKKMSPISLKISRKLVELYKNKTLQEGLSYDKRLSTVFLEQRFSSDLFEGVRALVIDKDNSPKWNPATLEEITDEMIEQAFEQELPPEEELNFYDNILNYKKQFRT